jgi:hypothetical protein
VFDAEDGQLYRVVVNDEERWLVELICAASMWLNAGHTGRGPAPPQWRHACCPIRRL